MQSAIFAASQTFSELNFWLGKGISLLLFTALTAWTLSNVQSLKEWKSCFGSCNANFFHWFSSGGSEDHMARASSATAQVATP